MSSVEAAPALRFDAPGPGAWKLDAVHWPRPATRYWTEMHPEPFARGVGEFTRFYGMLFDRMESRYVNGFAYNRMVPIDESEAPARLQRAEAVFAGKLWREQLRDWDETFKPRAIAKHRELQAVDPESLDDQTLVEYLARCRDHHAEMVYQHMRFTGAAIVPMGDLLAHVMDWTGLSAAHLLGMMRGSAPVSAGATGELQRLTRALEADASARALLDTPGGDASEVIRALRDANGEVGAAAAAWLDVVGYRLLDGFDISGRYALELPEALLKALRAALERPEERGTSGAERVAEVRDQVPEQHRAEFDELLEEARVTYRIRDERGVFSDVWASGIMRRAVRAGGRRLAERGRLADPEHFVEAGFDEMRDILSGTGGPAAEELATRFEYRTSHDAKDAPPFLGEAPAPPPDPSGLPPAGRRVMRATGIVIDAMFESSQEPHEEHVLRGLAASGGVYEGVARRVAGPTQFDRIQPGDVLVTESTTEAFNILLPMLGAIVTDSGGLLSHAAIVAREYGLPGVVGTRDGTQRIADGALVRVDGDAGEVAVRA